MLQVHAYEERLVAAEASAGTAEEIASAAMQAVEAAVQEEMEAAAVVKEVQSALLKALQELKDLDLSRRKEVLVVEEIVQCVPPHLHMLRHTASANGVDASSLLQPSDGIVF